IDVVRQTSLNDGRTAIRRSVDREPSAQTENREPGRVRRRIRFAGHPRELALHRVARTLVALLGRETEQAPHRPDRHHEHQRCQDGDGREEPRQRYARKAYRPSIMSRIATGVTAPSRIMTGVSSRDELRRAPLEPVPVGWSGDRKESWKGRRL